MANVAAVLKDEIVRLARKEVRAEVAALKKASALYRSEIVALKRAQLKLEQRAARLEKALGKPAPAAAEDKPSRIRYSAESFKTMRARMGLTAAEAGILLGVSAQTVYSWEGGKSMPRKSQLEQIAGLRGVGKRAARARLLAMQAPSSDENGDGA